MSYLYQLYSSYPILSAAQTLFSIWMVVDAYRRGAEHFWYWIIFLIPGLGAWAYFFAVLAPNLRSESGNFTWFQRKVPLEELRYKAEQTPTLANNLALGQRLLANGAVAEAIPFLEAAHKVEPEHGSVLFALAQCYGRQNQFDHAAGFLERVIKRDQRWSDYEAWRLLVDTHLDAGHHEVALEKARELVKISPTLRHKCILGEILIDQSYKGEARNLLDQALQDHSYLPAALRRRNRVWAKEAGRLLKKI